MDRPQNAFEFVTLAGARARQLLNGCTPKVETKESEKLVKIAQKEVTTGAVQKVENEERAASSER